MEENLKIWDKIYYKYYHDFSQTNYSYWFDEVERITKTLIITKKWKRLKNYWYKWILESKERFRSDEEYQIITTDIIEDNNLINKEYKINKWFNEKDFIIEEKEQIYNLFNNI